MSELDGVGKPKQSAVNQELDDLMAGLEATPEPSKPEPTLYVVLPPPLSFLPFVLPPLLPSLPPRATDLL
jgi:hypothetical protein